MNSMIVDLNRQDFQLHYQEQSIQIPKGQIIPKADWHAIDSPKKRTNKFVFFCFTVLKYLKLELDVQVSSISGL